MIKYKASTECLMGVHEYPYGSNFEISIDSMSDDGYMFTGRLNAIMVEEYGSDKVELTNGSFQFRIHEGEEESYSWIKD